MKALHLSILSAFNFQKEHKAFRLFLNELMAFTYKNAISCLFPVFIFLMLALSKLLPAGWMHRYDFLLLAFVFAQFLMYRIGLESKQEVFVITVFHLIGILLELHKVNVGAWSYPEEAITKVAGVPLYAGFMYASVASYLCRAWDYFDLQILNWPKKRFAILIGLAIYINFFTNAYYQDMRWLIITLLLLIFRKTVVYFNSHGRIRQMPLLLSFVLIGFFIWIAENLATYFGAWKYSYQHAGWVMVDFQKMISWSLLVIVSLIIVAQLKQIKSGLLIYDKLKK